MNRTNLATGAGALALFMSAAPMALAQAAPPPAATSDQAPIIVTATRQATNIQKTPVQVTAFSGQRLQDRAVQQMDDITYLAPSVRYTSNSGSGETAVTMRGIENSPAGGTGPGVLNYFEDVPQTAAGQNTSPYDIASIQVLQGPQGTLFGRNTIGGAILVDPVLPSYSENGYLKAGYGSYNFWTLEGAGNVTLLPDVLAVRVSGQIQRRDGDITPLGPTGSPSTTLGPQNNLATEAFRASILFTPTPTFKNVLTINYYHQDDSGTPAVLINPAGTGVDPGAQAALIACHYQCIDYSPLISQNQLFFRVSDLGVYDTATWQATPILTLKNIFGYQTSTTDIGENTDGGNSAAGLATTDVPVTTITEEFQARAHLFDDRLNWLVGAFYENDTPHGPDGAALPFQGILEGTATGGSSTAVFTNIDFKITPKITFHGGFRYTWDSVNLCTSALVLGGGSTIPTAEYCYAQAALGTTISYSSLMFPFSLLPPETYSVTNKLSSAPTWSVGFDYQPTDDLFFYVVTRRGYRAPAVNGNFAGDPCHSGAASVYAPGTTGVINGFTAPNGTGSCPYDLGAAINGVATGTSINLNPLAVQQAELLTDVELGMRADFHLGGWLQRLNLTYYHYTRQNITSLLVLGGLAAVSHNYIGLDISNTSFGGVTTTGGSTTADGLDIDLMLAPTRDLTLDFAAAYIDQHAQPVPLAATFSNAGLSPAQIAIVLADPNTEPQLTAPTPPWAFTAAMRYVLPWHPLGGDLVVNYNYFFTLGFQAQSLPLPGYDLHNLRLDWNNIGGSPISAGVWVRNLANKDYIVAVDNSTQGSGVPGDPRMVGFDITAKFH